MLASNVVLRSLSDATQGSAYLLTHLSWTSRMGTGFRKWSFSRPRRLVTTKPASSSSLRCFITPKRVIENRAPSALKVCPSWRKSSSRRALLVGSAIALNTSSIRRNYTVTIWSRVKPRQGLGLCCAATTRHRPDESPPTGLRKPPLALGNRPGSILLGRFPRARGGLRSPVGGLSSGRCRVVAAQQSPRPCLGLTRDHIVTV